jgi:hypothetical protein
MCYRIVKSSFFNWMINTIILVSLGNLCFYTYIDNEYDLKWPYSMTLFNSIELLCNCVFFFEGIMKIIAFGCFWD